MQSYIESEIIEMDYDTFISIIHYNPTTSRSIFNVQKGQKRSFIEKLFGLEIYSEITDKCNKKLSSINSKILESEHVIELNSKNIVSLKEQNEKISTNISTDKENQQRLIDNLIEKREKIKLDEDELNELIEKRDVVLEKMQNNSKKLDDTEKDIKVNKEKIALLDCKETTFDVEQYRKIKRKIFLYERVNFDVEYVEDEINKFNQDILKLIKEENNKKLEQKKIEDEIERLENLNSGVCPLCKSKIDKKDLKSKIESSNNELKKIKEELVSLNDSEKKKRDDVEKYEKKIKKIKKSKEKYQKLSKILNDLDIQKIEYDRWKENEEKIVQIKEILREKSDDLSGLVDMDKKYNKMIKFIDDKIEAAEKIKTEISKLNEDINIQKALLEEKERKHNEIKEIIQSNEKTIKENDAEIEKEKKNLGLYKDLLDYVEFIKKICKDENVKQYAISNTIPFLTKQVNKYLSEAAYDFYLKLDGWLNVEIKGAGIKDAGFGNLSSGQQKTTNLAMILSFLDICKLQKSTFPDILLLDEILDGAIDSVTLSQMFNIIAKKQKEDKLKLFIVSHRKEINELSNIDNIYLIEMKDGFSHIKRVTK